jgi:hypothetical protein
VAANRCFIASPEPSVGISRIREAGAASIPSVVGEWIHQLWETAANSQSGDDSLRLQAEGFWNDAGVSSHTIRSVHAQQRDKLKTTTVSHGTTLEHSSIFTSDPTPENPPKRYFVENVQ